MTREEPAPGAYLGAEVTEVTEMNECTDCACRPASRPRAGIDHDTLFRKARSMMAKTIDGVTYACVINNTGFNPLPKEEFGHGEDDLCCCRYCAKSRDVAANNPNGVWDTLATDLTSGKTWKVHFPRLHGRRLKRKE